jgi:hypothetical protein
MKLYKNLPCDNYTEINTQIKEYIDSTGIVLSTTEFWNALSTVEFIRAVPLFTAWLKSVDLKLHSLALTVGRDPTCCGIHVDTPPAVNKLSWPVLNTGGTFNCWFRQLIPTPKIQINSLGGKSYIDINELEEIGRMEVVKPCIINAGIPHNVWFDKSAIFPRVGLQCMLFNEPAI